MITSVNTHCGMQIQVDESKGQGCYTDILRKIHELLAFYTSKHNKALFIRFDVRYPSYYYGDSSNNTFSDFIACFVKFYQRQGYDPAYLWVREQSQEKHQHYHCILLLNGDLIQSYYKVLGHAEAMWNRKLGVNQAGLIDFCNKSRYGDKQTNGIMIRRKDANFSDTFRHCFHWASYLAKTTTKDTSPPWVREFGSSRIPKNWQAHPIVQSILM